MVALDVDNIQGVVLRGYRMAVGSYVFLKIENAVAGRRWVDRIIGDVTTAAPWDSKPNSAVNVAFTARGLRALGLRDSVLGTFSPPFLAGMASRAALLGDWGTSAPKHWTGGLGGPSVHALVWLSARTPRYLAQRLRWLDGTLADGGLAVVSTQPTALLKGQREHFGYADGFSQPDIEGLESGPRTGQGALAGKGRWRPVRPGEFVLGYPDEEGVLPDAPRPDSLARNGSYFVYRRLRQDVAGFRARLAQAARDYSGGEEMLAAKLVGRWRDGTPLDVCPASPEGKVARDPARNNAFSYADDPDGYRCPVGAHIRRVNPRESLPFDGKLVNRHRLVRRGLPYGPPLPPGAPDDGVDRGVVFTCFQADIARQFEFIQSQWLNDGNAFGLGEDKDVIVGDHRGAGKMTVQGEPPAFVHPLVRSVTVTGGEYFFAPGLNGLCYLSGLAG
ncbi:Dyp-type peroxidase [Frankia tisae]|nr:Dyp-type peroxidase [Frankia tisae]